MATTPAPSRSEYNSQSEYALDYQLWLNQGGSGGLGALATKNTVTTTDLDNQAVSYAKIQNVSNTNRLLGRTSPGAGSTEEINFTTFLQSANNFSDLASASTARTNLGLGTIAIQNSNSVAITGGSANFTTLQLNSTTITASANEINKLHGSALDASFVIGTQSGTAINVAIQLKDADLNNLSISSGIQVYLSDSSVGSGFIATAPSGTVAIGTNGFLYDVGSNKKVFLLLSNTSGQIDININNTGAKTLYVVLILPSGKLKVSGAVTFV